jgi:hypothetical protein
MQNAAGGKPMPENTVQDDAAIIQAAYAERVSEAFKVFAENLATGQSEQACTMRFRRALELVRKTRDMALRAATEGVIAEQTAAQAAAALNDAPGEALSAEDQALVDHALAGTTGHSPVAPPAPRYRLR